MPILRSGSQGPSMDTESIAIVAGLVRSFSRLVSWRRKLRQLGRTT